MASIAPNHRLVVAPMMKRTFPAYRHLLRRVTRHTLLVTEMISVRALHHGERDLLLPPAEDGPVAAQLGGVDHALLVDAARFAQAQGYAEVDINCGCPSDRATDADVGACLMREPERVAAAVAVVADAVDVPVTVKCRIGVVDRPLEDWEAHEASVDDVAGLEHFAALVTDAGAARVAVHARVAVLEGLDPRQNRSVPPLRHDEVHELARRRSDVVWQCNGGVRDLVDVLEHLQHVDGVLVGRAAWDDPMHLAEADRRVFGDAAAAVPSAADVIADGVASLAAGNGGVLDLRWVESLAGFWHGRPGARQWRHGLAQLRAGAGGGVDPADVLALLDDVAARVPA